MSRELKLAEAPTRLATHWKNHKISWGDLTARLQDATISPNTISQYQALPKDKQADAKDVGGFVGGHLADGLRRNGHVLSRSIITLDVDYPPTDFLTNLDDYTTGIAGCLYSTHSHAPGHERYRLVIPLSRDVTAEEYEAVARKIADDIDIEIFDDTTYEAHRLMYWPSRPIDAEFIYRPLDTVAWINPDDVLAEYDDWRDVTTWPVSSRQAERLTRTVGQQADPLTKTGIVGAFCRAHTIHDAIATFLPDVYTPTAAEDRYTYKLGEGTGGVVTYDNKFAYSHHGTDSAGGHTLNAFDLVRIHKFGDEDYDAKPGTPTNRLPSYQRMCAFAADDKPTRLVLADDRRAQAQQDFGEPPTNSETEPSTTNPAADNWEADLDVTNTGKTKDTLANHVLILRHDPHLAGIAYNEHADRIDIHPDHPLPWQQLKTGWSDTDNANLKTYLEKRHGLYSPAKTKDALTVTAAERAYHPIRDYLHQLPEWDGTPRLDTLLVDYLGADNTTYVHAVTRKTLVAAVARVMRPGIKFDQVLILNGPQGAGKSTIFAKLGREGFSDALTITDMRDKAGAEKLQGYWILELGELAGMRKMEVEVVKAFISRETDKYRPAYGATVEDHPRQCIIVGTTNAESGFLRDITGNRRFWPVTVEGTPPDGKKPWNLTTDEVDQIWAEALMRYKQGEKLYLTGDAADAAVQAQDQAVETDDRIGLVENYLDTPLPTGWDTWTVNERRGYLHGGDDFGTGPDTPGTRRDTVSNVEIWAECFGAPPAELRPHDSYAIAAIMQKVKGWERTTDTGTIYPYGKQRLYRRIPSPQPPF